tara:strand:- start:388 stop:1263 length:876 start_codon:yes stop_codon:yes gene_type:complete
MKINDIFEDGVIVPGVNTTVDVKPGETERQAAKFFGHGKPKELHKKARKNSHPNTLFNLGLAESHDSALVEFFGRKKKSVKQSDPLVVLDKLAARKDNNEFPIRMYDGSVMKIRPSTARRFIAIYLEGDEQLRKKLLGLLKTKSGFKEILAKLESINFDDDLLAEAWHKLVRERELTKGEEKKKEKIVKGMKKNKDDFKERYGKDAEAVMYATATKMAKNESKDSEEVKAFNAKTQSDIIKLKAKYPQADNILSALLADVDKNEKRSDTNDTMHDNKLADLEDRIQKLEKK